MSTPPQPDDGSLEKILSNCTFEYAYLMLERMASNANSTTATACAENISLLHLLHPVPRLPSKNEVSQQAIWSGVYSLSLEEERSLVGHLAFLSNTHDNVNYVPAICVREDRETQRLEVLVAINRLEKDDGNQIIAEIRQGFERIFSTIIQNLEDEIVSSDAVDHILEVIISMCSRRILRRLRFVTDKRGNKKESVEIILRDSIDAIKKVELSLRGQHIVLQELFISKAREAIQLADAWKNHQTLAQLKRLVDRIHRLRSVGDIQSLFNHVPSRIMDPSRLNNLFIIIDKVSRYRDIARSLYRLVRRKRILQATQVTSVSLPKGYFNRVPLNNYNPRLEPALAKIHNKSQKINTTQLYRLLNLPPQTANYQFSTQALKTLEEAKIHAEIQVIYHCELHPSSLPPRVIASSKDACYLCNEFIAMYGKIHTPRHHGRLYPAWCLPYTSNRMDLNQRFVAHLEEQIRQSVRQMMMRGKKTVYQLPQNESNLLTLVVSTSTLRSAGLASRGDGVVGESRVRSGSGKGTKGKEGSLSEAVDVKGKEEEEDDEDEEEEGDEEEEQPDAILDMEIEEMHPVRNKPDADTSASIPTLRSPSLEIPHTNEFSNAYVETEALEQGSNTSPSKSSSLLSPAHTPQPEIIHVEEPANIGASEIILLPGQTHLGSVRSGQPPIYHTAEYLNLLMDHVGNSLDSQSSILTERVPYGIQSLSKEDIQTLEVSDGDTKSGIIDVETLLEAEDATFEADIENCVYIRGGRVIVKLCLRPVA